MFPRTNKKVLHRVNLEVVKVVLSREEHISGLSSDNIEKYIQVLSRDLYSYTVRNTNYSIFIVWCFKFQRDKT